MVNKLHGATGLKEEQSEESTMNNPVRIAQIMGKMVNGGVDAVIMNYYRNIDRSKVQFDFVVDSDSKFIPRDEIESLGGRIYIVPPYQKIGKYISALVKLFKQNKYQIVHSNINTLSVFPLFAAKKAGVPVRIAHNHSTAAKGETKKNILKYILRPFSKVFATHYVACSEYAGEWLFGKKAMESGKVTIFNNAIDLNKFKFDEKVRSEVRKELGIEDKFVIGHVGRLCFQKNQEFLIDIFEEVHRRDPNSVLLLIGDGEDREKIERKIKNLRGGGGVILLGNRTDVDRMYQAMDVFIFPSKYEGLGNVVVEAQVCGVPVIVSDNVPEVVRISDGVVFLSLSADIKIWAEKAINNVKTVSIDAQQIKKYDIDQQAVILQNYYWRVVNEVTKKH